MTTDVVLAGLPLTVGPVSAERVQLWAQLASQVSTKDGFTIVGKAHYAFWMETAAYEKAQRIVQWLQEGWLSDAVGVADEMVRALQWAIEGWLQVVEVMEQDVQAWSWAFQWHDAARASIEGLSRLRAQVIDAVVSCCAQMQWNLPEHTQEYVASRG